MGWPAHLPLVGVRVCHQGFPSQQRFSCRDRVCSIPCRHRVPCVAIESAQSRVAIESHASRQSLGAGTVEERETECLWRA